MPRRFDVRQTARRAHGSIGRQARPAVEFGGQGQTGWRGKTMSGVRVLVGTRKGAFVMTADGKRDRWTIDGPHFGGWEIFHVKGSPVDPNRVYASQHTSWFGQLIQRS